MMYLDIYFEPDYARLYETENDKAVEYRFECEYGVITNLFLKRKVNITLPDDIQYYDIVTSYGYGGPVIHSTTDKEKLISTYMDDFLHFAEREDIVDEFVRFHPIIGNEVDFRIAYRYGVDEHPESLDEFVEIYYSTKDCAGVTDYYYFGKEYFREMMRLIPDHIITGKVFIGNGLIAMGVYFRYGKYLHEHLFWTLSEYLEYFPAYILKYALAIYGHKKDSKVIHYSGGPSRLEENGLYKFKREFGKNTEFGFYITKKIWNENVYRQICEAVGAGMKTNFFSVYREEG